MSTDRGSITLPVTTGDVADDVVWVPTSFDATHVPVVLGTGAGSQVRVTPAGQADSEGGRS